MGPNVAGHSSSEAGLKPCPTCRLQVEASLPQFPPFHRLLSQTSPAWLISSNKKEMTEINNAPYAQLIPPEILVFRKKLELI
jgi:hypothetical protein